VRSIRELNRSTSVTTDVGTTIQFLPSVQGVAYEQLVVADLLAQGEMDTGAIAYPQEVSFVSGATTVPETTNKPEQAFNVVAASAVARKIAAWTRLSTELLQDTPGAAAYLQNRLAFAVQKQEDKQILYGDGLGSNMLGIFSTPGIQTQARGASIAPDVIRLAIAAVEVNTDFICSGIVLHPTDFANIEMLKDGYGRYLVGQVLIRGELGQQLLAPSLWGKPIAVSKSAVPGTGWSVRSAQRRNSSGEQDC
jgi:HK97 family phage major capsid protein